MPLEQDLLRTARRLLPDRNRRGRPRQANLRRAISTAYYAVFHALCRMCANALMGPERNARNAWRQVYRAVEHGTASKRCTDNIICKKFPVPIRDFCGAFVELQEKRHKADYDPHARFKIKDVEEAIKLAQEAVAAINDPQLSQADRRAFAVWILLRSRA